ncbi:MAG: hypothetical protein F7C35_03715 [Desulfurococcales archaeon]|nr:hypothetical protein [Desulfurococcales archaeon]
MTPRVEPEYLQAVLCTLYRICGPTTKCHIPGEAVARMLPKHMRGIAWKVLEELRRRGLAYQKGSTNSYGLTQKGVRRALLECSEE